mmetsp:Transcript_12164/g.20501  ORF Transcript_12164/g.20501 Transcript_12164/m.20501 type:complete len:161 (-) Transcript_12164:844-1326(-)
MMTMLSVLRMLNLSVLNRQFKAGRIFQYNCANKENAFKTFVLIYIIVTFSVGCFLQNELKGFEATTQFKPLRVWILIELGSIIGEPIYFYVLLRVIRMNSSLLKCKTVGSSDINENLINQEESALKPTEEPENIVEKNLTQGPSNSESSIRRNTQSINKA